MRVGPGSVGVSVGVVSISVVSSIVQPWVSLGISSGLGFSLSLGFSLLNRHGRFLSSSSRSSDHWSNESTMSTGDQSSSNIPAASSQERSIVVDERMVSIGVGQDSSSGVDEGRISLGLGLGIGSDS